MLGICTRLNEMDNLLLVPFETIKEAQEYYQKALELYNKIYNSEGISFKDLSRLDFEDLIDRVEDEEAERDEEILAAERELLEMFFPEHGYAGCGAPLGVYIKEFEYNEPIIPFFSLD